MLAATLKIQNLIYAGQQTIKMKIFIGCKRIYTPVTISSKELFSVADYCRKQAEKIYLETAISYAPRTKVAMMQKLERIALTAIMLATGRKNNYIAKTIKIKEITFNDYMNKILGYKKEIKNLQ